MGRVVCLLGLCLVVAGCGGPATQEPEEVYEAVLRARLPAGGNAEGVFVQVDGKDPSDELLARLRKQWPGLRPASEMPKRKYSVITVGELKWVGRGVAEVRVGSSNGMDGHIERARVVWSNGQWAIESTTTEAIS
jgi:hypothetical protein